MTSQTLEHNQAWSRTEVFRRFRMRGLLTAFKLKKYLPVMLLTNLSNLLLLTVDGLIVGNLLGPDAFSSVNIFYPATVFVGVIGILAATGIATCFSLHIGQNDAAHIPEIKATAKWLMILFAAIAGLIQIPLVEAMIDSFDLSPLVDRMTRQYAVGVMLSAPFGVISTVGVQELQITGKMKRIMELSLIEGVSKLLLNLLLIGALGTGIAGAGYGTAGAAIIRCALTILCLHRETDIYRAGGARPSVRYGKEILSLGLADASYMLMQAILNYSIMMIILWYLDEAGGIIKGACAFTLSLALVIINGVLGSMRPLAGLLSGAKEWQGLRMLMQQCFALIIGLVGAFSLLVVLIPGIFYHANGVDAIPFGGIIALRLFALHFVFKGCNTLFRAYYAIRNDLRFSTILTIAGSATMPVLAFLIGQAFPEYWLWIAYLLSEMVILTCNLLRYRSRIRLDRKAKTEDKGMIYLSVKPEEAAEASSLVKSYADSHQFDPRQAYRIGLCLEEMVAYAEQTQKNVPLEIQIMIRFCPDTAMFLMIDNGRCISLDQNAETQNRMISNYDLIRKIAKQVKYQYILDMNYTVIEV